MIDESLRLYKDIDGCISRLLKARLPYDAEVEMKAFDQMEGLMVGTLQHLSYMIDHIKDVEFAKWIKVEDRLPEIGEEVLVVYKSKQCEDIGYRMGHRAKWRFAITDKNDFALNIGEEMITHWMPIVPPKED